MMYCWKICGSSYLIKYAMIFLNLIKKTKIKVSGSLEQWILFGFVKLNIMHLWILSRDYWCVVSLHIRYLKNKASAPTGSFHIISRIIVYSLNHLPSSDNNTFVRLNNIVKILADISLWSFYVKLTSLLSIPHLKIYFLTKLFGVLSLR